MLGIYSMIGILVAVLTALGEMSIGPAWAVPMALNSGDIIPGTVWQVTYSAPVVLQFDPAVTTNNTVGTIIETTNRTTLTPFTIDFLQVFETSTSAVSGGLRLNFTETVANTMGPAWIGYRLTLEDTVPGPDNAANADHPPEPHFHPTADIAATAATFQFGAFMFDGTQTTKYKATFKGAAQFDPSDQLLLGNGVDVVNLTQSVKSSSLLIHERQFGLCPQGTLPCFPADPGRREFRLIEAPLPVPEPGSISLVAIGFLAIIGLAVRRYISSPGGDP